MSGKHATVYKTLSNTSRPGATGLRGAAGPMEEPGFTLRSAILSTMPFEINGCHWSTFPTHKKKTDQGEWARLWALTAHSAAGGPRTTLWAARS